MDVQVGDGDRRGAVEPGVAVQVDALAGAEQLGDEADRFVEARAQDVAVAVRHRNADESAMPWAA